MGQSPRFEYRFSRSCCPDSRSVRSVGACALTARGDKVLEESRIRPIRSENSTQPVESQSTESSPKTRGPWYSARYQHQPTKIQPIPDQSNSWLPVRLASPMIFYQEWIRQQGKVPPDQTPSVPVNAQPSCPVRVELDNEDVKNQFPASAVRLQAESTPTTLNFRQFLQLHPFVMFS